MSSEHQFDEKNKVRPKRNKETDEPQKSSGERGAPHLSGHLDTGAVTQLQQTVGNTAVQRLLAQRAADAPTAVDEETAASIQREKGQGQKIDAGMAQKSGDVMRRDVGDVTVHTDAESDKLTRQLGAKAFTTGSDIFFREGEYNPNSQDGQKLIGHELTHVAQQRQGVPGIQNKENPGGLTVNDPNDQYEAEADKVADAVTRQPDTADAVAQRQAAPEEEQVQMQEVEEEEQVQMQEEEEEIQMQEEEEEIQMQQAEEEELQAG